MVTINKIRREIAYMLGAIPYKDESTGGVHEHYVSFGENSVLWSIGTDVSIKGYTLFYDKDFNLLISAVEFIESIGYKVTIDGNNCIISKQMPNYYDHKTKSSKKEAVLEAVYVFAAQYNKTNRKKQPFEDGY